MSASHQTAPPGLDPSMAAILADPVRLAAVASAMPANDKAHDALDRLARFACRLLGAPRAIVSLLDLEGQYHAGDHGFGLPGRRLPMSHSICKHVVAAAAPLVLDNTAEGAFRDHPGVRDLGIKAYLGVPLALPGGTPFGVLCVTDIQARHWAPDDVDLLCELAKSAMTQITLEREIRHRETIETRLRERDEQFSALADNLPGLLFQRFLDADGLLRYRFFGSGVPDSNHLRAIGNADLTTQAAPHVHPDDADRVMNSLRDSVRDTSALTLEYRTVTADGSLRWMRSQSVPRKTPQGEQVWDGFLFDVTDLAEARFEADRAREAQANLLANVNHELRTPLNAILGFSELLADAAQPAKTRERAALIHRAGRTLLSLVNQLLDQASFANGGIRLERETFDIRDMVENCRALMADGVARKGLALAVDIAPGVPRELAGDRLRLEQIIVNLLANAIKFTDAGFVRISVESAGIDNGEARLRFSVADSGIGIASEALPGLFQRFSRVAGQSGRHGSGTGLGLSICKQYAEAMGGAIGVDSKPGRGSSFWFEVVLETTAAADAAPAARRRLVLVAEDTRASQTLMNDILQLNGFDVHCVANGAEALKAIAARPYDLVLMDIKMPVMDGREAARAIRALPGTAGATPIIAVTANPDAQAHAECLDIGMNATLSKPVGIEILLDATRKWMLPPQVAA